MLKKTPRVIHNSILATAMFAGVAFAQDYTLSGKVRDLNGMSTGSTLQNVKVDVDSSSFIAKTDATGNYSISGIPSGNHTLKFSIPGHKGFNEQNYSLNSNSMFNTTLPSDTQTVSLGTGALNPNYLLELYPRIGPDIPEPVFWQNFPVLTYISNARPQDSTMFFNAMQGASTSTASLMQRTVYQLTTDSAAAWDHGLMILCQAGTNNSGVKTYYPDGSIKSARMRVDVSADIATWQHEEGQIMNKDYVYSFSSNMEPSAPTVWTLNDNILTWVAENHKLARLRGEQHAKLLTMEDYILPIMPVSSALSSPSNNAANIPLTQILKWANSPGADSYHLQLDTDSLFTHPVVNDSTIDRTSKSVSLISGTIYFARVRAKNDAGTSNWSSINHFTTLTPLPDVPILSSPANNATNVLLSTTLEWLAAVNANNYRLQVDDDSTFASPTFNDTLSATSKSVTLNPHTNYSWRVQSNNAGGSSAFAKSSLTTLNRLPTFTESPADASINQRTTENCIGKIQATDVDGETPTIVFTNPPGLSTKISNDSVYVSTVSDSLGNQRIIFSANDGFGGITKDTANILINYVNRSPFIENALRDTTVMEGTRVVLSSNVKQNVSDLDGGNIINYTINASPSLGAILKNDSLLLNIQNPLQGTFPVILTGTDNYGASISDTVNVSVTHENRLPVFTQVPNDTSINPRVNAYLGQVKGSDPDGTTPTLTFAPSAGLLANISNDSVYVSSIGGFSGPARVIYTLDDGMGGITKDTTNVTVNPNHAPVFTQKPADKIIKQRALEQYIGNVKTSDVDNDVVLRTHASPNLQTRISNDSVFTAPLNNYFGPAKIVFTADDGFGGVTKDTININVQYVNRAPSSWSFTDLSKDTVKYANIEKQITWFAATDLDGDTLRYFVNVKGGILDTTFHTKALEARLLTNVLQPITQYVITGKVTDGIDTTNASNSTYFWTADKLTGVKSIDNLIPKEYALSQNFPNPFNPATTIRYGLPLASRVSLKIYNVLGQQIADLVNTEQSAGWYETVWNANVSSGLYFYRIDTVSSSEPSKRFTQLKKMILLK